MNSLEFMNSEIIHHVHCMCLIFKQCLVYENENVQFKRI